MSDRPPLTFAFFPDVAHFSVNSDDISDGERLTEAQVADSMGYSGGNKSPQLSWSGFPPATKSFAITIHDPDAPTGSGFWHWCVVNIPASVTSIQSGSGRADGSALPEGAIQLRNDAGVRGYLGSAPPPGDPPHRYVTTVHAVDVERLEIDPDASPAIAGFNLRFHAIARGQLVPVYSS